MKSKPMNFKESSKNLFLRYAVIPIITVFILFFISFLILIRINVVINSTEVCNKISYSLDESFKNYYNETNRMSSSENVINYMKTGGASNLVYDEFYRFNNSQNIKSILHILDTKGNFLISSTDSDLSIKRDIIRNTIPKLNENPNDILCEVIFFNYKYNQRTVYSFSKAILDNDKIIGYIIYQLFEEDLQKLFFVQNAEIAVITDSHNRIIVTNNNSITGLLNKFKPNYTGIGKNQVILASGKYYIHQKYLQDLSINIYTLNSIVIKNELTFYFFFFIVLMTGFLWLLMDHLSDKVSSKNSESIDKLILSINELKKGNLTSHVLINSGDEFDTLADEYNRMLDSLKELTDQNNELVKLEYISEIKLLQSQFNPHFIFNVLETLRYSLIMAPEDAEPIIIGLSRLLRYSINYDGDKVLLEKDILYIEDYLRLCKYRFKSRLKYEINICDQLKNAFIPKLLLQGIVENSIKYGYENKENLEIIITGDYEDGKVIFQVTDDGYGMTKDQLDNINKILESVDNYSNHIGLHNVYRRLILLYGKDQSFEITSTLGKGTNVKISIPYEEGDNDV